MNNDYEYNGSNEVYPSYTEYNNFQTNNMNIKPPKKKRKWPIVLLILLLLIVGVLIYLNFFTDKLDFIKSDDKYSEFDPNKGKIESNSNIVSNSNKPSNSNKQSNSNKTSNSNKQSNSNSNTNEVKTISITPSTPSVVVGSKVTLKTTITPNDAKDKSVTWKSSDTKIATVDSNGIVTGVKVGTTTITATSKNGRKASVKVTVTAKKIPVTGVNLNITTLTMKYTGSTTLLYSVLPSNATNKDVIWNSSNSNIVSVDSNGYVVGKNPGTATITVTTKDGGYKDTILITVPQPEVNLISINGNRTVCQSYSTKLTATVEPSVAKDKTITWTSSNTNIATINSSGVITGKEPGTVTITASTKNGTKTKLSFSVVRCSSDYSLVLTQTFGSHYYGCYGAKLYFKGTEVEDWMNYTYNGYTILKGTPLCPSTHNIDKTIKKANIKFNGGSNLRDVPITYK